MKVNDVIKTKSGKTYTVQRSEKFEGNEYLLLFEVGSAELSIASVENDTLKFVNSAKQRMALAQMFDEKQSKRSKK